MAAQAWFSSGDAVDVAPGSTVVLQLTVVNLSDGADTFVLTPTGMAAQWTTVRPATVTLVAGAQQVVEAFEHELGVRAGETTDDGQVTFRTVECLGGCGWGTVVSCDHRYRHHVKPEDVPRVVDGGDRERVELVLDQHQHGSPGLDDERHAHRLPLGEDLRGAAALHRGGLRAGIEVGQGEVR